MNAKSTEKAENAERVESAKSAENAKNAKRAEKTENNENIRLLKFIGLCRRAGKLALGSGRVADLIKGGRVCLVLLAVDASENTKKKYRDMCTFRDIDISEPQIGAEELGNAVGATLASVVGVLDRGFADRIKKLAERVDL